MKFGLLFHLLDDFNDPFTKNLIKPVQRILAQEYTNSQSKFKLYLILYLINGKCTLHISFAIHLFDLKPLFKLALNMICSKRLLISKSRAYKAEDHSH